MFASRLKVAVLAACLCFAPLNGLAQTSIPTQPARVQGLQPGWEDIDQRFLFLTEQLMLVENEVAALNKALVRAGYQQAIQQANADRGVTGNEIMDRRGGGPVDWWTFYGTTAEKFFYHPDGPNDFYSTHTTLVQRPSLEDVAREQGVPSRQGLPVHQRPPQFDYFYRANDQAKDRAEKLAAALGRDVQRLLDQRRQRETKQAELWCLLSLRGVTRLELGRRPTYRFQLKIDGSDAGTEQRRAVINATARFIRTMNQLAVEGQEAVDWERQGDTFEQMRGVVTAAQKELDDVLLRQPSLVSDLEDRRTPLGMVAAAAQRLIDASANLVDAQQSIVKKQRDKDDLNKDRHRAILQQAVFDLAANVQTLDQCFLVLNRDWKVSPDVTRGLVTTAPTPALLRVARRSPEAPASPDEAVRALGVPTAPPAARNPVYTAAREPKVVAVFPGNGSTNVDPAVTAVRVTFDQPMNGGFNWNRLDDASYPQRTGEPRWLDDRTCILPVKLEPNRRYRVGLNIKMTWFRSLQDLPLKPYRFEFATSGRSSSERPKLGYSVWEWQVEGRKRPFMLKLYADGTVSTADKAEGSRDFTWATEPGGQGTVIVVSWPQGWKDRLAGAGSLTMRGSNGSAKVTARWIETNLEQGEPPQKKVSR